MILTPPLLLCLDFDARQRRTGVDIPVFCSELLVRRIARFSRFGNFKETFTRTSFSYFV